MFHGSRSRTRLAARFVGSLPSKHAGDIVQVRGASLGMTAVIERMIVRVPMTFRKAGGRNRVIAPDGYPSWPPPRARIDNARVKALARAFRWRRMLETGAVMTIGEIAAKEKINASYVSRALRLTLLAPEIVEAILDGRQEPEITLPVLMGPFPVEWGEQRVAVLIGHVSDSRRADETRAA